VPKERLQLLVVDDAPDIRKMLRGVLEDEGHTVEEADTGEKALERLDGRRFDVVLLDLSMPGMGGLEALPQIVELAPDTAVVVVSGEKTTENAVQAIKRGAFDFIEKPFESQTDHLLSVMQEAVRATRIRRAPGTQAAAAGGDGDLGIVGRSGAVETLRATVRRVAPSLARVLVSGENGSGKELVAHAIHVLSKRAQGPFVKINCAAIPKDLVESELFGYERGAFTGANQAKPGKLELADKGTLFLDEIGDLSLESQAKLLRAIETGEAERVGGTRPVSFDVRIVSATNKDLRAEIDRGDFREDLYYRLNVLPIHVPPLRERRADIGLLGQWFLDRCCKAEERPPKKLDADAIAVMEDYAWPGNVRELKNLMERAAILVEGDVVRAEDLAAWLESGSASEEAVGLRGEIERREADAIRRALESANGNVTQAAAGLGIDRTNLHRKMRKYGIARH
jgi:two-component system nitrogen regulation response regulator NtrX